jgi:hypothetical protein
MKKSILSEAVMQQRIEYMIRRQHILAMQGRLPTNRWIEGNQTRARMRQKRGQKRKTYEDRRGNRNTRKGRRHQQHIPGHFRKECA